MEIELWTWEFLGTATGATVAVTIITQAIKNVSFLKKVPTQLISYVVAVLVMFAAAFFNGILTVSDGILIFGNAIMISLAANGTYMAASKIATSTTKKAQ